MPALASRQTGQVTITPGDGASGTISISSVVPANAYCQFSIQSADTLWRDFRHMLTLELTDATTLTWRRFQGTNATDIILTWWVVESTDFTVQRGTITALGNQALTALNSLSESFLIYSLDLAFNIINYNGAESVRAELTSTTNLALTSSGTPTAGFNFHYQVVECPNVSVQRGTIDITLSNSQNTAAITSVDLTKSFVNMTGAEDGVATSNINKETKRVELTDATTVTAIRGSQFSTSGTDTIGFEVIEFTDSSVVYRGLLSLLDTEAAATSAAFSPAPLEANTVPIITGPYLHNVILTGSGEPDDVAGELTLNASTGNIDSITATRTGTSDAVDYPYAVVEFNGAGGSPNPTITDADDEVYKVGDSVVISGTNFEAVQGTGTVLISPTDNIADAGAVAQTVTAWAAGSITIDVVRGALAFDTQMFLFVRNDTGDANTSGYAVQFEPDIRVTDVLEDEVGTLVLNETAIKASIWRNSEPTGVPDEEFTGLTTDGSGNIDFSIARGVLNVGDPVYVALFKDDAVNWQATLVKLVPAYN